MCAEGHGNSSKCIVTLVLSCCLPGHVKNQRQSTQSTTSHSCNKSETAEELIAAIAVIVRTLPAAHDAFAEQSAESSAHFISVFCESGELFAAQELPLSEEEIKLPYRVLQKKQPSTKKFQHAPEAPGSPCINVANHHFSIAGATMAVFF